jgi:hypothetical protein
LGAGVIGSAMPDLISFCVNGRAGDDGISEDSLSNR